MMVGCLVWPTCVEACSQQQQASDDRQMPGVSKLTTGMRVDDRQAKGKGDRLTATPSGPLAGSSSLASYATHRGDAVL